MNQVVIVATGSEITNGKSTDTNSGWIANELSGQGFSIRQFIALPDDPDLIYDVLSQLIEKQSANWIIMTGGLGPTEDDYTVDVVLKLTNQKSMIVEKAKRKLQAIYEKRGVNYEAILPTVLRQTRVPEDSEILENRVGIAPGFIYKFSNHCKLVCMPGVPPEMRTMFEKKLLPRMLSDSQEKRSRGERTIWNIGESLYQEEFIKTHPLLQGSDVEWGVTAKRGYIKTTFLSKSQDTIDKILSDLDERYIDRISGNVFEDLHKVLIERGQKIAIAESCTGGWTGKILTDMPGSSEYFIASLVTYHNQAKENILFVPNETLMNMGAVSEETAKVMLSGLEKHFDIDFSVSITGIAGPGGGTDEKPVGLVYIGVKRKGKPAKIMKYYFPGNREMVRESTANNAIFQLYKEVIS
ncbi:MAG: nicotinamide-nucleotide amidohydrolase family protein [Leptospira sp.]|nr:nicotinamide-nucleotide amidohydrolase family protein [Leptospira sp.]